MEIEGRTYLECARYCLKVTDGTHDTPKPVASNGKHLITSKHIKGGEVDYDSAYLISKVDFDFINKRSKVDQWDVIISMIGAYCGFCFLEENPKVEYAVKNVGLLKAGSEENARWLYYYLNSPIGKAYLAKARGGSSQPYLSLGALRNLPVLVPTDNDEKASIVELLTTIDRKIALNNKINARLEAMAKLIYDYWFVQFDFPNENSKPYKASGGKMVWCNQLKRDVPEGWEAVHLGEITRTILGGTPASNAAEYWDDGTIPWLSSGEVSEFPVVSSNDFVTEKGIQKSAAQTLAKGTTVISIVRHLRISFLAIEAATNQSVVGICENETLKSPFLCLMLKRDIPRLMTLRTGAQQPHINKEEVDRVSFAKPPADTLNAFYAIVQPYFEMIENKALQNQELANLRDWLLPMLMNGQVTVGE